MGSDVMLWAGKRLTDEEEAATRRGGRRAPARRREDGDDDGAVPAGVAHAAPPTSSSWAGHAGPWLSVEGARRPARPAPRREIADPALDAGRRHRGPPPATPAALPAPASRRPG